MLHANICIYMLVKKYGQSKLCKRCAWHLF